MLAARKTRNLRGSFRPRLPWTEKRSERFRNYRPERSTFQCSRTATANRSTRIIPHGSGKRRGRGNLWNQENLAAKNEYRLKDFQTLHKTRRDLPEIGRFSSRREGLRSLCCPLSFFAEANPQVSRIRHKTRGLSLLIRLFSTLQFDENCRLSGRLGAFFCARMGLAGAIAGIVSSATAISARAWVRHGGGRVRRNGEAFSARAWGSTKSLRTQPRHAPAKFSLRSLNLPPILVRGFARRAFRLFAPARFLQGFWESRERTKGGICARPAKF